MYHNLLLTSIITIFVLIASVSLPYLLFPNQYIMAAHSSPSSKHKTKGDATIQICCSWGKEIDDGILTYRIDDDANPQVIQAVHQAIDEWNSKVPNIQLQKITDSNADIDIKTKSKAPKVTHSDGIDESKISAGKNIKLVQPGEAQTSFDRRGFITHVDITISTKALGNAISLSGLQSIVKHEIGHAYGIGHTNFIGDLMSPVLTDNTNTDISQCVINGIEEANTSPPARAPQFLRC
jgi:matrixin